METTATEKGQIVIPSALRQKYGIEKGTKIQVVDQGDVILLRPITAKHVKSLRGILNKKAALKTLIEMRRKEKDL
ncbi:MAG: AbrB/MazE/SpoVT family DNA-binding domain-containing protein [Deltaproteobacteria bacterium]|nr:AbrB/MazE/SpoVT family DNA-binding domain-containing protein [Deltaproteobacteria bacterium]